MTSKSAVAKKFGINAKDLKAVVFYSDRSYSRTVVFGAKKVFDHFAHMTGPFKPKSLTHQKFSKLAQVPDKGHLVDATSYGYESGSVLLVSGSPPKRARSG